MSRSRVGKKNIGSRPFVGSPREMTSHASPNPSAPPRTVSRHDSASTSPKNLTVVKTDGLEHTQFAGPFAHRLRHGVAGDQQDGEKHRAQDGGDNQHDVADLTRPRLHKRALRLRLGFRRRILKLLVHPLRHFHRLRRVRHPDGVPADQSLAPVHLAVFIEVIIAEE